MYGKLLLLPSLPTHASMDWVWTRLLDVEPASTQMDGRCFELERAMSLRNETAST